MSNYRAYSYKTGSFGHMNHVLNTMKYGRPGFYDDSEAKRIAEDVQERLLGAKHPDANAMVHTMSGLWQRLVRQDEAGWDRVKAQGEYFDDVLKEMGMSVNADHIKYGWKDGDPFEKVLSECVKVRDPEKAAQHLDIVSDPAYTAPEKTSVADRFKAFLGIDGRPEKPAPKEINRAASFQSLTDGYGLGYDEGSFRDELKVMGLCERADAMIGRNYGTTGEMAHDMAVLWGELQDQDMTGRNGMREQGRYFKGVAAEMGMDLNIAGTKRDFPVNAGTVAGRGRDRALEEAICSNMTVGDPEKAKEHFKEVSDPHYVPKPSALDKLKGFLSKDEADGRAPGEPGIEAGDDAGPVY